VDALKVWLTMASPLIVGKVVFDGAVTVGVVVIGVVSAGGGGRATIKLASEVATEDPF
jgi:hypothetical protein